MNIWNRVGGSGTGKGSPRNDLVDDNRRPGLFTSNSMSLLQFQGQRSPNTPAFSIPGVPTSSLHQSNLLINNTPAPAVEHFGSSASLTTNNSGLGVNGLPPSRPFTSSLPPLSPSGYRNLSKFSSYPSNGSNFGFENKHQSTQLVKEEASDTNAANGFLEGSEDTNADDLVSLYMNLDGLEEEDMKEKTTNNPNINDDNNNTTQGFKDHNRSLSLDSYLNKLTTPSSSTMVGTLPPPAPANFESTVVPINGEFTGSELKKIMANLRLTEIARTDPKRAKRILANRQSAARSKEKRLKYIAELERKIQTLQIEVATLSSRLSLIRGDITGITRQNNELKYLVLAMEQQARLRDALNETLNLEVQRLKLLALDFNNHIHSSNNMNKQIDVYQQQAGLQLQLHQHQQSSMLTFQSINQQQLEEGKGQMINIGGQNNNINFVVDPKDEFGSNF